MRRKRIIYQKFDLFNIKNRHNQEIKKSCQIGFASITLFLGVLLPSDLNVKNVHADDNKSSYINNSGQSQLSSSSQSQLSLTSTYVSSTASNAPINSGQVNSNTDILTRSSAVNLFKSTVSSSEFNAVINENVEKSETSSVATSEVVNDNKASDADLDSSNENNFSSAMSFSSLSKSTNNSSSDYYYSQSISISHLPTNLISIPINFNYLTFDSIKIENNSKNINLSDTRVYNDNTIDKIEKLQGKKEQLLIKLKIAQSSTVKLKVALKNDDGASAIFQTLSIYNSSVRQTKEFNEQIQKINKQLQILQH